MRHTLALWKHTSFNIVFTLVEDDFGVNYSDRKYEEHLRNTLKLLYSVTTDWTVSKNLGRNLKCDYINMTVDMSMTNYFLAALHKFQHKSPESPRDAPTAGPYQHMANQINMQTLRIPPLYLQPEKCTWSRRFTAPYCTISCLLTPLRYRPLGIWRQIIPKKLKTTTRMWYGF